MWKSDWKMSKEKWMILLICGIILLVIAFPFGGSGSGKKGDQNLLGETGTGAAVVQGQGDTSGLAGADSRSGTAEAGSKAGILSGEDEESAYEKEMEQRVKEILKNVQGVGQVDVMITLKSSKEKVIHVDKEKSRSSSEEKDSAGGTRTSATEEIKETALMSGSGQEDVPVVEKELQPEIAGIVISAQGGGSATVKAEISEAMQALFDIPAHKIKVLKRVE